MSKPLYIVCAVRQKHNIIGRRRWNIVTQELNVCDKEFEIVNFVVKGSVKQLEQEGNETL